MSVKNSQRQSSDFVISRLFMKLFNTSNIHFVKQCQEENNFKQTDFQVYS